MANKLPKWASLGPEIQGRPIVNVDAPAMYKAWLEELGVAPDDIDQYWLECAYQCGKMELQVALGMVIEIRIHDTEKKFALVKWPEGKGVLAASKGREAREHFKRLRGFIPS